MTRRVLMKAVLVAALCTGAPAVDAGGGVRVDAGGRFQSTFGYRVSGEHDLSERDFLLDLEGRLEWGQGWQLRGVARGRSEDRLEPEAYREASVREFVLTKRAPGFTLNLGRQQVVWGKADGLRLLDGVNPLDLREFILDDYGDSRIPLWMANLELFRGDHALQLLVIPDLAFDRLPSPGGEFFALPGPPASPVPVTVAATRKPAGRFKNWEAGVRWSAHLGRLDLTLNALHGWSDSPVPFRTVTPAGLLVEPRIVRRELLGFSGDLPVASVVLRFEGTWTPRDYVPVTTPDGVGGFTRQGVYRQVVGVDWIHHNWLLSPQWFQQWIPAAGARLVEPAHSSYLTFLARRSFRQDRLTVQVFGAYGFLHDDVWIAPRVSQRLAGRIEIALGADLLAGDARGAFGRFSGRDRLTLEATLHF